MSDVSVGFVGVVLSRKDVMSKPDEAFAAVLYPMQRGGQRGGRDAGSQPMRVMIVPAGANLPPGQWPPDPEQPPGSGPPGSPQFPIWGPPGIDWPDKPGYPPSAGHPLPPLPDTPPVQPPTEDQAGVAIVKPLPPPDDGSPPEQPPEGMPQGSVKMAIWFGPGTLPTVAWIPPYVSFSDKKKQQGGGGQGGQGGQGGGQQQPQ